MSEYQYHELQAVDQVLTPEEQAAVDDCGGRMKFTNAFWRWQEKAELIPTWRPGALFTELK